MASDGLQPAESNFCDFKPDVAKLEGALEKGKGLIKLSTLKPYSEEKPRLISYPTQLFVLRLDDILPMFETLHLRYWSLLIMWLGFMLGAEWQSIEEVGLVGAAAFEQNKHNTKRQSLEEESGGQHFVLGALDVKDAFLQVPQEEPTQVTTAGGHFLVKRNLPQQRIGARSVTGVSLSIGHEAFLFICLPGPSLLVPCSISIHLSFRSVTGGVRPCPLAMKHFYSFASQVRYCCCPPFSVGHVAFLFICLPGLSLLVSALFVRHVAFLFISLPGLSLLVSALFRWRCNISIHLFSRSVTAGVRPFPLGMQHFYSFVSRVCHWCCRPFPLAM